MNQKRKKDTEGSSVVSSETTNAKAGKVAGYLLGNAAFLVFSITILPKVIGTVSSKLYKASLKKNQND